ncbi:hypothetical protein BAE44_0018935 [Dichanthelium oligosanthes]|uniref:Uncharacterized protein n=1 Tax=Dichanthelium oligosanthes TaxID=888268 RepID=A0A1E5V4F4_9POAL|nr:hypothetical protein BAE44_0018935 [Dichanthelium oligosanthes]
MDSNDDRRHGYIMPVPRGGALHIIVRHDRNIRCPICPSWMQHNWDMDGTTNHDLGLAKLWDDKNGSRHHRLSQNMEWMDGAITTAILI